MNIKRKKTEHIRVAACMRVTTRKMIETIYRLGINKKKKNKKSMNLASKARVGSWIRER